MTIVKSLDRQLAQSESLYRSLVGGLPRGRRHARRPALRLRQPALPGDVRLGHPNQAPASLRDYLEWSRGLAGQGVSPLLEWQGLRGGTVFDLEMNTAPAYYHGRRAMLFTVRDVTYRKSYGGEAHPLRASGRNRQAGLRHRPRG